MAAEPQAAIRFSMTFEKPRGRASGARVVKMKTTPTYTCSRKRNSIGAEKHSFEEPVNVRTQLLPVVVDHDVVGIAFVDEQQRIGALVYAEQLVGH